MLGTFCLSLALLLPLHHQGPAGSSSTVASTSRLIEVQYTATLQPDGTTSVELVTNLATLRVERWNANRKIRLSTLGAGPRPDGAPQTARLMIKPLDGEDGKFTFRITNQAQTEFPIWIVLPQGSGPRSGKVRLGSSLSNDCPTWCFFAWMECTSGGQVTKCCDQRGDLVYDDNNCAIYCPTCP